MATFIASLLEFVNANEYESSLMNVPAGKSGFLLTANGYNLDKPVCRYSDQASVPSGYSAIYFCIMICSSFVSKGSASFHFTVILVTVVCVKKQIVHAL